MEAKVGKNATPMAVLERMPRVGWRVHACEEDLAHGHQVENREQGRCSVHCKRGQWIACARGSARAPSARPLPLLAHTITHLSVNNGRSMLMLADHCSPSHRQPLRESTYALPQHLLLKSHPQFALALYVFPLIDRTDHAYYPSARRPSTGTSAHDTASCSITVDKSPGCCYRHTPAPTSSVTDDGPMLFRRTSSTANEPRGKTVCSRCLQRTPPVPVVPGRATRPTHVVAEDPCALGRTLQLARPYGRRAPTRYSPIPSPTSRAIPRLGRTSLPHRLAFQARCATRSEATVTNATERRNAVRKRMPSASVSASALVRMKYMVRIMHTTAPSGKSHTL